MTMLLALQMPADPPSARETAPAAAGGQVSVALEATLGADGSMRGVMTATWSGACAADLRARLKAMTAQQRATALALLAEPPLAGRVKPAVDDRDLAGAADLVVTYAIDAPRYAAPPAGAGGSRRALSLRLPLLRPYDPMKVPPAVLPLTVNQDVVLKLPPDMAPLELPSAFSTVTPDAGRYVLWFDTDRSDGPRLKIRREMAIDGTAPERLKELMEGMSPRDGTAISILPVTPRRTSG